jgi:hypothetical protein
MEIDDFPQLEFHSGSEALPEHAGSKEGEGSYPRRRASGNGDDQHR